MVEAHEKVVEAQFGPQAKAYVESEVHARGADLDAIEALLRQMRPEFGDVRSDVGQLRTDMATKADLASLRADVASDLHTLRTDVAADILTTRKQLGEQIVGLRRAVIDYHTSVIGHGVIISDLKARVRRVEQHLNLPSLYPT